MSNFLRSLSLPDQVAQWSLTTLREKLVKIGANPAGKAPLHPSGCPSAGLTEGRKSNASRKRKIGEGVKVRTAAILPGA